MDTIPCAWIVLDSLVIRGTDIEIVHRRVSCNGMQMFGERVFMCVHLCADVRAHAFLCACLGAGVCVCL